MSNYIVQAVESQFLEPPRETKIGLRNREFEKSKVASNVVEVLFYKGQSSTFS